MNILGGLVEALARLVRSALVFVTVPALTGGVLVVLRYVWEWMDSIDTGLYGVKWPELLGPWWHAGLWIGVVPGTLLALLLLFAPSVPTPAQP